MTTQTSRKAQSADAVETAIQTAREKEHGGWEKLAREFPDRIKGWTRAGDPTPVKGTATSPQEHRRK